MIDCDLLVIGSGIAGLWAAISAREAGVGSVVIMDKGSIAMSSQSRMAAGATIYCLPEDDPDDWIGEFVTAQRGLSRRDMLRDLVTTSYGRLKRLESWGVTYQQAAGGGGYLRLPSRGLGNVQMLVRPQYRTRVGGGSVVQALRTQATRLGVRRHPRVAVTDLMSAGGRVAGAVAVDRSTGEVETFRAKAVVLAAGDCSFRGTYAGTDSTTGDAFRLAYDAGARLSNMEFLCVNTGPPTFGFEGTGVVLRFGGRLVDGAGRAFMSGYHPDGDSAEVNHLVQAMALETRKGNGPPFYLDMTEANTDLLRLALDSIGGFMPPNLSRLAAEGVDVFSGRQEWLPCVQSLRGGVRTDADCASDVEGLFAAGLSQAFDPGLFNGWSTSRAMWSGERAGVAAADFLAGSSDVGAVDPGDLAAAAREPLLREVGPAPDEVLGRLHERLFPFDVCILKEQERLRAALAGVEEIRDGEVASIRADDPHELTKAHETANMVFCAEAFLRASLARCETRGDHFREDFPETDNEDWLAWVNVAEGERGEMCLETEPVPIESYA